MDTIKRWLLSAVLKKVVLSASKLIVSFAASHSIKLVAAYNGYNINLQDEAGLVVAINTGLKALEHWLAHKYPAMAWLDPDPVTPLAIPPEPLKHD